MRIILSLGVKTLIALFIFGSASFTYADTITPDCGFLGFIKRPFGFCPAPIEVVFNAPDIDIDQLRAENRKIIDEILAEQLKKQGRVAGAATSSELIPETNTQHITYKTAGLSAAEAREIAYSVYYENLKENDQFAVLLTALSMVLEKANNEEIHEKVDEIEVRLMKNILSTQDDIGDAIDDLSIDTDNETFSSPTLTGDIALSDLTASRLLFSNSSGYLDAAGGLNVSDSGFLMIGTTSARERLTLDGPIYLAESSPTTTTNRLYNSGGNLYWNGSAIAGGGGSGTVTSVAMSVPTGFAISGSPVTTSGTLALAYDTGYTGVLSASTTEWATAYGWGDHSGSGYLTSVSPSDLSLTQGYVYVGNSSNVASATSSIFVDTNRRVGIGTVSPSAELEVWGDLRVGDDGTPTIVTDTASDYVTIGSTLSLAPLAVSGQSGTTSAFFWGNTNENKVVFGNASFTDFASIGIRNGTLALSGGPYITDPDLTIDNAGEVGVGDNTPNFKFEVEGSSSNGYFGISSADVIQGDIFIVDGSNNVGIGTSTPSSRLQVQGNLYVTGSYRDSSDSAGSSGYVLQSTGSATQWVATSSLGITGATTFTELTDTPVSYTANQIFYDDGSSITGSNNFVFDGSNVGIGTSTPDVELVIDGDFQLTGGFYDNAFTRGVNGQVLQTDASGVYWVSTSSLGIGQNIDVQDINLTQGYTLVGDGSGNASATSTLYIKSDRNVGIGTINPQDKLHISGNILMENTQAIRWKNNAATAQTIMAYDSSNNLQIGSGISGALDLYGNTATIFNVGGTEYMRLLNTGRLGIGDDAPDAMLEVSASGGATDLFMLSSNDGNDGDLFIVKNNGNVGIGTTTPSTSLSIEGSQASYLMTIRNNTSSGEFLQMVADDGNPSLSFNQLAGGTGFILLHNNSGAITGELGGAGDSFLGTNLGIGTTSPQEKLQISASGGAGAATLYTNNTSGHSSTDGLWVGYSNRAYVWNYENTALSFATNNTEYMTIDTFGNVGIGTTSPASLLHVRGLTGLTTIEDTDGSAELRLYNSVVTPAADTQIGLLNFLAQNDSGGTQGYAQIRGFVEDDATASGDGYLTFLTKGAGTQLERMRIDSSGNVGIGTTSPQNILHVFGTSDLTSTFESDSGAAIVKLYNSNPTPATDEWLGMINFKGQDTAGNETPYAQIRAYSATSTNGSESGYLAFYTTQSGSQNVESLRIDENGNIGIGTTSPNAALHISRPGSHALMQFENTNNTVGKKMARFDWATDSFRFAALNDNNSFLRNIMTIEHDGNVGIGTTTPDSILNLVDADPILLIKDTDLSITTANARLRLAESGSGGVTDNYWDIVADNSANNFGLSFTDSGTARFVIENASGGGEWMRIDNSGNVGIGTTTPDNILTIKNTVVGGGISLTESDSNTVAALLNSTPTQGQLFLYANGTKTVQLSGLAASDSYINAGNVGIGDTTPDDLLNIHSASAQAALAITSLGTDTDSLIKFELADGTPTFTMGVDDSDSDKFKISGSALGTNDRLVIDSNGWVGIGTSTPQAQFHFAAGTHALLGAYGFRAEVSDGLYATFDAQGVLITAGSNLSNVTSGTAGDGGSIAIAAGDGGVYSELGAAGAGGNVYISAGSDGGAGASATTRGDMYLTAQLVLVGSNGITDGSNVLGIVDTDSTCYLNANNSSPTCGSDRTLKKDIEVMEGELQKILALEPSLYHWKTQSSDEPLQSGFIAQEVELVLPELVTENEWVDGTQRKFLNIGGMMPYVVGAIKELWEKVTGNTEKIESLEARIEALEAQLNIEKTVQVKRETNEEKEAREDNEQTEEQDEAEVAGEVSLETEDNIEKNTEEPEGEVIEQEIQNDLEPEQIEEEIEIQTEESAENNPEEISEVDVEFLTSEPAETPGGANTD